MKIPAHEATTAQLGALFPGVVSAVSRSRQVLLGRQTNGELFCFDPFELYELGVLTNPNMLVIGQIGRGKSSFVKTFLFRQAAFDRRIVVLDPKGEYGALAAALGVVPVKLAPGGKSSLNPLASSKALSRAEDRRRRLHAAVVVSLAVLERALSPGEHLAIEVALDQRLGDSEPSLAALVTSLLDPQGDDARSARISVAELRAEGRAVAFGIRRFITGELAGIFGGERTDSIDADGAALFVDLSAIYRSQALGPAIACVQLALEARLADVRMKQTVMVIDEAWAVLSNLGAARFLQSSLKLARSSGTANIVVAHRVSDLRSTGEADAVVTRLSEGLLADCETVVSFAQAGNELTTAAEALGLNQTEALLLTTMPRGSAIWHVGRERFLVEHRLGQYERNFVDTDRAMRDSAVLD